MKNLIIAMTSLIILALPLSAQEVTRKLSKVTGDVYVFQNNFHLSLVVATEEGTVRVDPINAEASAWVNDAVAQVTDKPITHLIYSHSHADHASGGEVYAGATIIAHENAPASVHGVEPTMRVGDAYSFDLGGKTFELTNLGSGHDNHMLAVVVRPENVAFIVDVAAPKRLPYRDFGGANVDDWIGQIAAAQRLDFEIFVPGHGPVGNKADLDDAMQYMQDLKAGVLAGLKAGKTVDELKAELTLDDYSDWQAYDDFRPLNIEGMARYLKDSGQV